MFSSGLSLTISLGFLLAGHGVHGSSDGVTFASRRSPPYTHAFQVPLTIPQVKQPLTTYANPETGVPIDFYQVEIKQNAHSFYPNLKNGSILGFDGTFPGPTFRIERGRESVVRVINKADKVVNFHVHGSYTRSPWDGWAEDVMKPGEFKDYYYPHLASGRTLWYHDHSNHDNAVNIYRGLFGAYQIVDSQQDKALGIPTDTKYDIPLMFSAHYFTNTGDLTDESKERASIYGDTWLINGKIKPFLDVEPRKYRFRVVNGAASRTLNLTLDSGEGTTLMHVIASDGGLRQSPAATKSLITGMGERWEVVVDFAPHVGKKLTLRATNMWTDKAYEGMEEVMQFNVGKTVSRTEGNGPLPERFAVNVRFPVDRIAATREFKLVSHMDMMWGINSYHMDDTMKRILMRPPLGTIEKYVFRSNGMGMSGGMGGSGGMHGGSSTSSGSMMGGSDGLAGMSGGNMGGSSGSTHSSHHGGSSSGAGNMMGGGSDMAGMNTGNMGGNVGSTQSGHHGGSSSSSADMMGGHGGMPGMNTSPVQPSHAGVSSSSSDNMMGGNAGMSGMNGGMMMGSNAPSGHSSHHGGGSMAGMGMMKSLYRRLFGTTGIIETNSDHKIAGSWSRVKGLMRRQMNGMMGGNGGMGNMMGNQTMMKMDGYWTHAMHLHLVDMKVLSRTRDNTKKSEGRDYLEEYEKDSIKDVVLLGSNERIEVLVKFVPYSGVYMFHCHNMVHEDSGMMAVMNISRLADLGYSGLDTRLEDPMDKRFRPQKYVSTDLGEVKSRVLPAFAGLKAYPDPVALAQMEEKYWTGKELPKPEQTSELVSEAIDPRNMEMINSMHGPNGMAGMNGKGSANGNAGGSGMDMNCDIDSMDGMGGTGGMNDMKGSSQGASGSSPSSSSSHSSHHGGSM